MDSSRTSLGKYEIEDEASDPHRRSTDDEDDRGEDQKRPQKQSDIDEIHVPINRTLGEIEQPQIEPAPPPSKEKPASRINNPTIWLANFILNFIFALILDLSSNYCQ